MCTSRCYGGGGVGREAGTGRNSCILQFSP